MLAHSLKIHIMMAKKITGAQTQRQLTVLPLQSERENNGCQCSACPPLFFHLIQEFNSQSVNGGTLMSTDLVWIISHRDAQRFASIGTLKLIRQTRLTILVKASPHVAAIHTELQLVLGKRTYGSLRKGFQKTKGSMLLPTGSEHVHKN